MGFQKSEFITARLSRKYKSAKNDEKLYSLRRKNWRSKGCFDINPQRMAGYLCQRFLIQAICECIRGATA